jgi:O-acetyl-ADP-ribose deacetylase (regulator of RNase III)
MPIIKTIKGDLLNAHEPYIAQQCNCLTVTPHGLSTSIGKRFPYAAVYSNRRSMGQRNCAIETDRSMPGTIQIAKSINNTDPIILCMFAQWGPGKCGKFNTYPKTYEDTVENRCKWFQQCLDIIDSNDSIMIIAMPYLIGCGLAGGDWKTYEIMLNNAKTDIVLYQI